MHVSYGKCRRLQRKWEVLIFPLWWDLPPKFSSDFPVCFLVTYRSIYLVFLMKLLSYPEVLGFYKTCRTNYSKSLAQSLECHSCSINMLTEWKGEPWFFDSIRLVEDLTVRLCLNLLIFMFYWSTGGSDGKESGSNPGDLGSISGLGRSPGEGNGNPPQCSCLENPIDRGAWQTTVHGVTKSQTWLSN